MKKLIGLGTLVLTATVLFFTSSKENAPSDTKLSDLLTLNTANAECPPFHIVNGKCLVASGVCVFGTTETDCSP